MKPLIVKLGGSLAGTDTLTHWLTELVKLGAPVIVVPGGAAFADTVRSEQRRIGFSDRVAHAMAIMAMEQYGLALCDLERRLVPCTEIAELKASALAGAPALWLPMALAGGAQDIPASWDATSDTIAAWLARRLGARALLLVKAAPAPAGTGPADWTASGLVDPCFAGMAADFGGPVSCLGPEELGALRGHAVLSVDGTA